MPETIIAELPKGPLDKLVISIRQYQGHTFVDLRMQFLGDDDQWHPTKKGGDDLPQPVGGLHESAWAGSGTSGDGYSPPATGRETGAMNAKRKGTSREHASKRLLEALGYTVFRMAGSHGLFDLIGVSPTDIVFVQCKSRDLPYGAEWEALEAFKTPANCRKIVRRWRGG